VPTQVWLDGSHTFVENYALMSCRENLRKARNTTTRSARPVRLQVHPQICNLFLLILKMAVWKNRRCEINQIYVDVGEIKLQIYTKLKLNLITCLKIFIAQKFVHDKKNTNDVLWIMFSVYCVLNET
jgi:hypothetical protein